ncbi:MAG: hypothetical protein U1F43_07775 [Myxococcota bacterium]
MFTNAFPLLFGLRAESNVAASFMGEGLSHAPSLALGLRWAATPSVQPVARVFVEYSRATTTPTRRTSRG